MKRALCVCFVVVCGAIAGALPSSAAASIDGTIRVDGWYGTDQCDFTVETLGLAPPAASILWGSTFEGRGTSDPCDAAVNSVSDIGITYETDISHWDMYLHPTFTLTENTLGCSWSFSTLVVLHGGALPTGKFNGTGAGVGAPFICGSINVDFIDWQYAP